MSVCGHIRIYLVVYGPEIIGGFGVLRSRKNKLWRFAECAIPIIDTHSGPSLYVTMAVKFVLALILGPAVGLALTWSLGRNNSSSSRALC